MRLFGTFKSIEVYLIVTAIFLLYSFDQLCEKNEENMNKFFYKVRPAQPLVNYTQVDSFVKLNSERRPLPENVNVTTTLNDLPPDDKPFTPLPSHHESVNLPTDAGNHIVISPDAIPPLYPTTTLAPQTIAATEKQDEAQEFVNHTQVNPVVVIEPVPQRSSEDLNITINFDEPIDYKKLKYNPNILHIDSGVAREPKWPLSEMINVSVNVPLPIEKPSTPPLEGVILPTDAAPDDVIVSPDDIPPFYPSTLEPQPIVSSEKPAEAGFWGDVFGVFGGVKNLRVKRNASSPPAPDYNQNAPFLPNQSYLGTYRCEKANSLVAHIAPFKTGNIFQQIFAWRFWGIVLLSVHLFLVLYHSLVNVMHRVPTSHRFNRVFAFIGLIIWDLITLWIVYQALMWNHKFIRPYSPIFPSIPAEFYAFLVLSFAMNIILLYELITPMTFFLSYDITPRHPRRGYVPAAQSENEYISGIIRQLEAAPQKPVESSRTRPVIRTYENDMV
uniref:Uncharacterized protein n=1 Tax=Panagrolaimus sp. ES5 TaxID=591445 RepID=A0AC34GYU5_9BILA